MKLNIEKLLMVDFMDFVKPQNTFYMLDKGECYEVTLTSEEDYRVACDWLVDIKE